MKDSYSQFSLSLGLQAIPEPTDLPLEEVFLCKTRQAAIRLSLNQAKTKRSDDEWAKKLGCTPGTFSTIMNTKGKRKRYPPDEWIFLLPYLTGNNGYGQWCYYYPINQIRAREIERKREALKIEQARLEELERQTG